MDKSNNNQATTNLILLPAIDRRSKSLTISTKLLLLFLSLTLSLISQAAFASPEKVIAITEIVDHPSLAQAKKGVLDELANNGYVEGKNLKIISQNAQGSLAVASLIAKKFVSLQPDAIVPISSGSAQTVLTAAKDSGIPIIFSSVTDPVAAGLVKDITVADSRITGAIDFPPIDEEIELIKTLVPNLKSIGILYNAGEANSAHIVGLMKEQIGKQGQVIEATAANSAQVNEALNSLIGRVEAIYLPSDNTVYSAMPQIVKIAHEHKIPLFSNDPDSVRQGVLACNGYSQYEVGQAAGKLLVRILKGEKSPLIEKPLRTEIFVSAAAANHLNIKIPAMIAGQKVQIIK